MFKRLSKIQRGHILKNEDECLNICQKKERGHILKNECSTMNLYEFVLFRFFIIRILVQNISHLILRLSFKDGGSCAWQGIEKIERQNDYDDNFEAGSAPRRSSSLHLIFPTCSTNSLYLLALYPKLFSSSSTPNICDFHCYQNQRKSC